MIQKVLRVGSSAAVTIPKRSLQELGLEIGDSVTVNVDTARKVVSFKSAKTESARGKEITELALNFVNRYRADLEALARK
ncbi:MAG: AbrB/MazE/SpoVT family DNA-binding domain-containing protein [bacterium]|nr:AbrB/MazE/SpoVT family DNA-binding domain-containing protein [bacterium]